MLLVLFVFASQSGEAKVVSAPLLIGGSHEDDRWRLLGKFGFGLGTGSYGLRVRLRDLPSKPDGRNLRLHMDLFLDEDWGLVGVLDPCERAPLGPSRRTMRVDVPLTGAWGRWTEGTVSQNVRPHVWYVAISNCRQDFGNATYSLDFDLRAQQADGSEFSVEMRRMLPLNLTALLIFTSLLFWYTRRCQQLWRFAWAVHPVVWILTGTMLLQYAAQVLHTTHLCKYKYDGSGSPTLDFLSEVCSVVSQVIQTTLLIAIALGYTLLHSKECELQRMRHVGLLASLVHTFLVGFGKYGVDSEAKFHENEGVVGWTLLVLRCLLYLWFLAAARASRQRVGLQAQSFLKQFQIAGSLYFLAYPAIFALTQVLAPYIRHPVMHIGLLAMQTTSHLWLASLFLSRGVYFKVSNLSSPMLPGCARVRMD